MPSLIKNEEKVKKIIELNANVNTVPCRLMVEILKINIEQAREVNDHITPDELKENQGKIAAYKELMSYIELGDQMAATRTLHPPKSFPTTGKY